MATVVITSMGTVADSYISRYGMSKKELRTLLYDRQNGACPLCGFPLGPDFLNGQSVDTDHKIPRSKGGTNSDHNLAATHRRCNARRGDSCSCDVYGPDYCCDIRCERSAHVE